MPNFPPRNAFREKHKKRIAAEARNREIERAEANWAFLQEESRKTDEYRKHEETRSVLDQRNTLIHIGIAQAQLQAARKMNWITAISSVLTFFSVIGVAIGVWVSYESMLTDQRAWVVPFKVTAENGNESNFLTYIKVTYKNTGKTPALETNSFLDTARFLDRVPVTDIPPENPSAGLLGPDGVFNTNSVKNPFPASDLELITTGRVSLYVYGTIWYKDIFRKSHWTQFCYLADPNLTGYSLCPGGKHNQTDETKGAN